jgi:Carboxylesterase family
LVWIHGGGLTQDAGRNYDPAKLAADGIVTVTINYRLGALGFLAHPALASRPGGPAGNYGLMDQQAALRWVRDNIRHFGGDPDNVTIARESAGGLSALAHLVSRSSHGLFAKAIIEIGAFALNQQPLASYDLSRLARNGLIARVPGSNRYTLTRDGLLFAHFYTKVYDHILRPLMAPDRPNAPPQLAAAIDVLDRIAVSHIATARVPTAA